MMHVRLTGCASSTRRSIRMEEASSTEMEASQYRSKGSSVREHEFPDVDGLPVVSSGTSYAKNASL